MSSIGVNFGSQNVNTDISRISDTFRKISDAQRDETNSFAESFIPKPTEDYLLTEIAHCDGAHKRKIDKKSIGSSCVMKFDAYKRDFTRMLKEEDVLGTITVVRTSDINNNTMDAICFEFDNFVQKMRDARAGNDASFAWDGKSVVRLKSEGGMLMTWTVSFFKNKKECEPFAVDKNITLFMSWFPQISDNAYP